MAQSMSDDVRYDGPPFFSYGFRPFFFSAAVFAGIAIPAWAFILSGLDGVQFSYPAREWHVHEMVFGFLPCVITGFILTAIPNWTDRPPFRGLPLVLLWALWLCGRLAMAVSWFPPHVLALIDTAFLFVVSGIVWREIVRAKAWERAPIGVLITLYASANLLFHRLLMNGTETDLAERISLTLMMILIALIGGKITPGFTEDYLAEQGVSKQPAPFSPFDGLSIISVVMAGILWMINFHSIVTGGAFLIAGILHVIRVSRWYGWLTWREPLVLILHIGYSWLAMALLIIGGAILGIGVQQEDAIHALTTGAAGAMTLGVMTRASLGHTGRVKQANFLTVMIYILVVIGGALRVFGPSLDLTSDYSLALAAGCWSGAYLLFAISYCEILFGQSLE